MEFKTYVQNIAAVYVEKQNRKAVFVKHYNTLDISREEMLAYVTDTKDTVILYHEFEVNGMHTAYEPFLEWISKCYDQYYKHDMTAEDFLEQCQVYSMHIEPLAGYINNTLCTRKEDVLHFETQYEAGRMLQSLADIMEYISKEHPLMFILSKFHLAPYSTIQMVQYLLEKTDNIHAIVMYNDEFLIAGYKKGVWDQLINYVSEQNLQLEWGSLDSESIIDKQDEFWFDRNQIEDYISRLTNMYHTFALQDAVYYISFIMYQLDVRTNWFDRDEQVKLLELAALINMETGHVNQALTICDKLHSLYKASNNELQIGYTYHYLSARTRMIQSQIDHVKADCNECIQIAEKMENELQIFKAQVLLWSAYYGIGRDIFEYNFRNSLDLELVAKTRIFGFRNFTAYLYVFGYENDQDTIRAIASGEREPYYFNLGIQLGKALGNENFLLVAYMKNIILYSEAGYYNYVRQMYEKRLGVLKRPNPRREAHMFAGLGYNSIILEDYEKAHEYLMKSICSLTELEEPDDVMNSLYNLSLVYFVAESYENVIEVIVLLIKMLNELGYQSIGVCNTSKLYALLAISYYEQGEYYNSYYYLRKIELILDHMLHTSENVDESMWEEDLLLYHLIRGMLYHYENKLELCQREMDTAKSYMQLVSGDQFYILPFFALKQAAIYKEKYMKKAADDVLQEAIVFCAKEGLLRKRKRLEAYLENGTNEWETFSENNEQLPVSRILQITRQVGTQNKLKKKENDIGFLITLQELISRDNLTVDELFQKTASLLKSFYNLNELVILRREKDKQYVLHEREENQFDEETINSIFDYFTRYEQPFLTNRTDRNFKQFMPVIQYFDVKHIVTMIGIPIVEESGTETILLAHVDMQQNFTRNRVLLNGDDLLILKFAFTQFCESMRKIDNRLMIERMNQELEQSAVTDYLTGIMNRNGLGMQVDAICAQSKDQSNVILYMDLDNFKYYNDTFGHEIGDLVLVCFAQLFQRLTKNKGIAVRYGGDEFIILLYNHSKEDGVHFAEQIYQEIQDGFQEEIGRKMNTKIEISKDKMISCSIGISSFMGGSKEAFDRALNEADQMLYYVKRHGKSRYAVSDDIL